MSDRKYRIRDVWKAARYNVMRRAVTMPILGSRDRGEEIESGALRVASSSRRGASLLVRLWRKRVMELAEAGWSAAKDPIAIQYLRNCPPFGVSLKKGEERAFRCCRPRYCPHCWAVEYVFRPFIALESFFYGPRRGDRSEDDPAIIPGRENWRLYGFQVQRSLSPANGLPVSVDYVPAGLAAIKQIVKQHRTLPLFKSFVGDHGFTIHKIGFEDDRLILNYNGVALVPPGTKYPHKVRRYNRVNLGEKKCERVRYSVYRYDAISKATFEALVSRACRWPQNAFTVDPELFIKLHEGLGKPLDVMTKEGLVHYPATRLLTRIGVLRTQNTFLERQPG